MTTRTVPDLKELFKQASEIAQQVPPNMQEAAFNRALDLLTGGSGSPVANAGNRSASSGREQPRPTSKNTKPSPVIEAGDQLSDWLNTLDSTQHPGVSSAGKHLDRALMVLQIALNEQDIDGLSPGNIARVLREKFRVSAAENAIAMALSRASTLVDRVKRPEGYVYRIMSPGIAYLTGLDSGNVQRPIVRKVKRTAKATKPTHAKAKEDSKADPSKRKPEKTTAPAQKRGSSGLAPKAAVLGLISDGFFAMAKTGLAVQDHLKTKRGYTIGTDQLRLGKVCKTSRQSDWHET